MKERTKMKFAVLAVIFVIGTAATVGVTLLAGDNGYLRQLLIIGPSALAGYVISSKEKDPLLPQGIKAWIGFIIATLFITTLFWALERYTFS